MDLPELDFGRIRATGPGGQREAFEQFVCELAAEESPQPDAVFVRLQGAGGDGGVECFWTSPDGGEDGWQAKFWVDGRDVDKAQLDKSVKTALTVHPLLVRYTIGIPVDPTGPTARKGKSLHDKVYADGGWLDGWKKEAVAKGMTVEFRVEWRSSLMTRLRTVDTTGVRARYWFDPDLLTDRWWQDRLDDAVRTARPRYIPELNVDVPAAAAMAALCGDPSWRMALDNQIAILQSRLADVRRADGKPLAADLMAVSGIGDGVVAALETWRDMPTAAARRDLNAALEAAHTATSDAEHTETEAMTSKHGGNWDTPGWRQFQAEYQVAFPAAPVDSLRALKANLEDLTSFLAGPFERLPGARAALLTGAAGTGKTFVTCDMVSRRLSEGGPSLFVHGRWFGAGDLLVQLGDRLQLPTDLTGEDILALLDQAGRTAGSPVLIIVDALNETRPRTVWRDELDRLVAMIDRYEHLRVVFTVRSHYHSQVVPAGLDLPTFVHRGFEGVEFEAVTEYADYYSLEPPTTPPVHGEFDNPLFLRLLCQALNAGGRLSLDQASMGIDELVRLLLDAANDRISDQLGASGADRIVHRAMTLFARAVGAAPKAWLDRATAARLIRDIWPDHTAEGSLLEALIGEGLLAEDIDPLDTVDGGSIVVAAFERLGQHLVITEAMTGMATPRDVDNALRGGNLRHLLGLDAEPDRGLLEALSVAVAHRLGVELTAFQEAIAAADDTVLDALIAGLPWRTTASITDQTRDGVLDALGSEPVFAEAMGMLFRLAARPDHPMNADYLHDLLSMHSMAERDSYLVPWLHETHDSGGAVDRLISWGRDKDISTVGRDTCRLWVTALLWCTGCPDRRVRDGATLAAARLLSRHPGEAPAVLARFLASGDDWIVERACYAVYAAVLRGGSGTDWRAAADAVWRAVFAASPPTNAAIRDEARSIIDAAADRGALPPAVDTAKTQPPYDSAWPVKWPDADAIAAYDQSDYPKLAFSCTGDDFFTYQIGPAFRNFAGVDPEAAGRRILQDVVDLGYDPRLHAWFDGYVLQTFGGGRGKPKWIERIGKKYQWIALARLVGIVGDHVTRTPDSWDPPPPPVPGPQSNRLRQLDPTVCEPSCEPSKEPARLRPWVPSYDWSRVVDATDEVWVADDSDLPDCAVDEIGETHPAGVVLTGSYEWRSPEQANGNSRRIWVTIVTLLVKTGDMAGLLADLNGRDLAGHEIFGGSMFMSGLVGEYPYGHHYAAELHMMNHEPWQPFAVPTLRAAYDLLGEYEYAPGDLDTISLDAPSPAMFGPPPGSLRWDGRSAWVNTDGRVIASVRHALGGGGHNELTMDRAWFDDWLRAKDLAVVWIEMIGKDVYTKHMDSSPGRLLRTRVRYRTADGVAQLDPVSERVPARTR